MRSFGSGLNRPLEGVTRKNWSSILIIPVAGLFQSIFQAAYQQIVLQKVIRLIHANDTTYFSMLQNRITGKPKMRQLSERSICWISVYILHIYNSLDTKFQLIDDTIIHTIYKPRSRFSHKGTFGHALIVAGSDGKIGAAVLSSKACLHSGARSLLTCHIPEMWLR